MAKCERFLISLFSFQIIVHHRNFTLQSNCAIVVSNWKKYNHEYEACKILHSNQIYLKHYEIIMIYGHKREDTFIPVNSYSVMIIK